MLKLASVALAATLGVAGMALAAPAEAHPYVGVSVGVPVAPLAYAPAYGPFRYAYGPYWRPGFDRYGRGRFYRRWNRC